MRVSPARLRPTEHLLPPGSGLRPARMTPSTHSAARQPPAHRGGRRVVTGRALHSLCVLERSKTRLILSIYDDYRLLQRSALESRAARTTYSASVAAVSRTEEAPGWVTSGAADVTAEHHMHFGDDMSTSKHRSHTMARPPGHALCMLLPCSPVVDTCARPTGVHGGARTWPYLASDASATHTAIPCVLPSNKMRHPMPSSLRHVPL